jgi:hypothetical protein
VPVTCRHDRSCSSAASWATFTIQHLPNSTRKPTTTPSIRIQPSQWQPLGKSPVSRTLRSARIGPEDTPIVNEMHSYNRYISVASRVVRRSLKEDKRIAAERRGESELRFAKWEVSLQRVGAWRRGQ